MKFFGKEFKFNNKRIYHEGDKPVASDIVFTDGENFQQKLDNGSLKGPKGDTGIQGETGPKGDIGPVGPKGETGSQGPQGPTGAQGTKGADGFTWRPSLDDSGNLSWTKDSSSTTPSAANIKGPKGDAGAQGPQGLKGEQGPVGPKGEDGKPGATGPQGVKGDTGPQGPSGPTGQKGADGLTWRPSVDGSGNLTWTQDSSTSAPAQINIKGPKGDKGDIGPKGETGSTGAQGPAGPKGDAGAKGADGLTTSITVNGEKYSHSGGNITLPNYLKETGGTVTGNTIFSKGISISGNINLDNNYHIIGKNTTGDNIYLLSYNSSNNLHLGSTLYDNSITEGKTFLSGAGGMYVRTVSGNITISPGKTGVAVFESGGLNINSKSSDAYKFIDIHRKCSSNTTPDYSHSTARIGCVNSGGGCVGIEYRENDVTKYYFQIHKDAVYLNGYKLFLQTGTPTASKTGDVWIDI